MMNWRDREEIDDEIDSLRQLQIKESIEYRILSNSLYSKILDSTQLLRTIETFEKIKEFVALLSHRGIEIGFVGGHDTFSLCFLSDEIKDDPYCCKVEKFSAEKCKIETLTRELAYYLESSAVVKCYIHSIQRNVLGGWDIKYFATKERKTCSFQELPTRLRDELSNKIVGVMF